MSARAAPSEHVRLVAVEILAPGQIGDLVDLYRREWWTAERTLPDVERMLAGSDVTLGLVEPGNGRLAAFARALTDGVYKALILDVIVAPHARGTGVGRRLLETLLAHPRVAPAHHKELYCLPELVPFYARFGFGDDVAGTVLLRAVTPSTPP